ncbi:hypothetical protein JCM8097_003488 [Rhodosporidiobolus ruineniae]
MATSNYLALDTLRFRLSATLAHLTRDDLEKSPPNVLALVQSLVLDDTVSTEMARRRELKSDEKGKGAALEEEKEDVDLDELLQQIQHAVSAYSSVATSSEPRKSVKRSLDAASAKVELEDARRNDGKFGVQDTGGQRKPRYKATGARTIVKAQDKLKEEAEELCGVEEVEEGTTRSGKKRGREE